MDLNQKILAGLLAGFLLVALIRVFSVPLKLTLRLLANTLLGFGVLWLINRTAALTGVSLGLNLWNALTIGILGLPGVVLLLLVQWVLSRYIGTLSGHCAKNRNWNSRNQEITGDNRRFQEITRC